MNKFIEKLLNEKFYKCLTYLFLIILVWGTVWAIIGEEAVPPKGHIFNLLVLFIISYSCGRLMSLIGLPPLLGMLISGIFLSNTFEFNLNKEFSSIIRSTALVIILLRAGLGLDSKAILKLCGVCLRLSLIPCLIESIVIAIVSHFLLNISLVWSFLLGFVLTAVSPAVVVPQLIKLQENGYGVDKGLPTLVIASSSVDNVLAITGFGLCLGLVFDTQSSIIWNILKGPVEALIGILFGILIGLILWYIPPKQDSNLQRLSLLLLSGMFAIFGSLTLNLGGAGPLASLVIPFVAALKWRQNSTNEPIVQNLKLFWIIFETLLFGLIGTEVKLSELNGDVIGLAFVTIGVGVIIRAMTAIIVVFGADLNLREKLFIGFSWLPKGTVQAAIGPMALDMARNRNDPQMIETANLVLTIAVLSIVLTAPIGAVAIAISGTKFLSKSTISEEKNESIEEYERILP